MAATVMASDLPAIAAPSSPAPSAEAPPSGATSAPDAASARSIARLTGRAVEIIGERTEYSSTWARPDGSMTRSEFAGPVWVRKGEDATDAGSWAAVDLRLEVGKDGVVRPKAHPRQVRLSNGGDSGEVARMDVPGGVVAFQGIGKLPKPQLEGSRATYADVKPGIDLIIEMNRGGFEQFWVIRDRPGSDGVVSEPALGLDLVTEGVDSVVRAAGHVDVIDAAGAVVATMPDPSMWDAAADGERSQPITSGGGITSGMGAGQAPSPPKLADGGLKPREISTDPIVTADITPDVPAVTGTGMSRPLPEAVRSQEVPTPPAAQSASTIGGSRPEARPVDVRASEIAPDRVRLDFTPDADFLEAEGTEYPVVVDPAVEAFANFDTYVQSNVVNTDYSGATELRLGTYDGSTVARSFLNMNMNGLQDKVILQSHLWLWNFHAWSCAAAPWEVWETDLAGYGTRWGNQPAPRGWLGTSTATAGGGSCADGWVSADITEGTQRASNRLVGEWGLGLYAENEASTSGWKKFDSASAGAPPHLAVTYRNAPNPARHGQISDSGWDPAGRLVSTDRPELSFEASHPDGSDITALFYVYEGSQIVFQAGVPARSGERARVRLPAGVLKEGRSYKFRATTWDNYTFGPDGWNRITPAHSLGRALDIPNCGVDASIDMHIWDWYGNNCQRFGLMPMPGGYNAFLARSGAGLLDQAGCGRTNGTRIRTWYPEYNDCQQFAMQPSRGAGNGQYRLLAKVSGLAMDIAGGSPENGAAVNLWAGNGCLCQEFRIDPAGDNGLESFLTFRTDFSGPGAPFLSSSNYPSDGTWTGGAGTNASFTFRPSTNSGDLAGYEWNLDAAPVATNFVANTGTATISVPMDKNGPRTLQVVAKDHAGNRSAVATYKFNVGRAGITQPPAGHHAVRRVRLSFDGDAAWTHVKYSYRRGEQALTEYAVPLPHVTKADGSAMTSADGFLPAADVKQLAIWDVGATLGFLGGPVQVRATMRDAKGATYQTPWVSFTLDRDAAGASGTTIGPGDVNLLTGDYVHSTTDAEEAGLSVSRTASSRAPGGGRQLQAEQLTANQVTVDTDANGFVGSGTTVTRVADRGHAKAGALRVVPAAGASGTDTFAALGGLTGLQTKLTAGRSYRVSGWVYVPATSGLDPPGTENGLRIVVATKGPDGTWTYQRSAKVGFTDAWQQLTLDATVPAGTTDAMVRLYSGFAAGSGKEVFFDDLSVRQLWAPFGAAWSTGVSADVSGTDYARVSLVDPEVAQIDFSGGGKIWFTKGHNGWWPEFGAESLTLTQPEPDVFRLAELDGTLTVFRRVTAGTGDWLVESSSPPTESGTTRYVYETTPQGITRIKRAVAPAQPGIDMNACATATPPPLGCVVLEYAYAAPTAAKPATLGDYPEQVREVRLWTTDPVARTVSAEAVARYAYDDRGRLREVWDPRIAPELKTKYGYDDAGRVTGLTPVGEVPWTFTYGEAGATKTGAGDWIDPNPGRLLQVSRASLVEGSVDQLGEVNRTSVVYGVPSTRGAGGPYELGADAIKTWGQTEAPTDGTAVFGPDADPKVSTATATAPGSGGYASATVHYLNAAGRTVNVATPAGPGAPPEAFIDTQQYDKWGNVVRSLEATNRLLALRKLTDAGAQLSRLSLGDATTTSAQAADALSTLTRYSADGMDVLETTGPTQLLAIGNDSSSVQPVRDFTQNVYDEGKPEGLNYHLVTTETEGVKRADGTLADATVTRYGYGLPAGCPAGSTSGWGTGGRGHGQPTTVTFDATGRALTSTVCYDSQGRATESRRPGSTGSDAGTTRTVFWTAGPNPADPLCGDRPEWAGAPCVTRSGGAVQGADLTRMAQNLPVKRILSYSRYGSAERVEESATGPVNGVTATQTRTTVTTYDQADRVISVRMEHSGPGVTDAPVRTTTNTYDQASGDVVRMEATENGVFVHAVTKQLDMLGRLVGYNDGNGAETTTRYDSQGRPEVVSDVTLGTSTEFFYDPAQEPRGFVTSVKDSVAGTISASYGPDGQLVTQQLPGAVTLAIGYDPAGVATSRTYTVADGPDENSEPDVLDSSTIVENGAGQWLSHRTAATSEEYAYDALGRLTDVREVVHAESPVCTWRRYTWNDRAGRESMSTSQAPGQTCVDPAVSTSSQKTTYGYDSADRLQGSAGAQPGTYTYDPLGRITTAPVISNPGAVVRNSYYANDLIAAQEIDGVARMRWKTDALHRFTEFTSEAWVNGAWANAVSKVNHYDSDSDSPSWIAEDATLDTAVTRFVDGLDGQLALETSKTGGRVLQLVDLHGDVMSTLSIADEATTVELTAVRHKAADEFGNPTDLTTGGRIASTGAAPGADGRYGWLGGAQRSSEALAGVVLMGVRLYDPVTGRFWSTDAEPGGNATAYDYCSADPINCTDLDGRWGFFKKLVKNVAKKVAKVAEIASNIPGPIGSLSAAVSAGAYAAMGNRRKALEMGITAAAAMIPGGGAAVRAGFKMARAAGKTSAKAGRACRVSNSFTPQTPVLMADGTTTPISDIEVGDMVAARDPLTGELTAQPVLDVIIGTGDKHLIGVKTARGPPAAGAPSGAGADFWIATANHPIWVEGNGWTDAEDLQVGDQLIGATGTIRVVEEIIDHGRLPGRTVYNLSVANTHTYTVGDADDGTLVHNASCSLPAPSSRAARRDVMRAAGIPTNLQPARVVTTKHGRAYEYNVPGRGRMAVVHGRTDRSHKGAPHWEAGRSKGSRDSIGRPRISNVGKVKRYY